MPPAIGGLIIAAGATFASGAIVAGSIATGAILAGINYGGPALHEPEAG